MIVKITLKKLFCCLSLSVSLSLSLCLAVSLSLSRSLSPSVGREPKQSGINHPKLEGESERGGEREGQR